MTFAQLKAELPALNKHPFESVVKAELPALNKHPHLSRSFPRGTGTGWDDAGLTVVVDCD